MDFSLRHHLPDVSDASLAMDASEATFQIPSIRGSTSQLLLEDDCDDFFAGMDSTLTTPAPPSLAKPRNDNPLTLAELTPRSRRTKVALRYTPSPRKPTSLSPLKQAIVAQDLDVTMEERLSPFKPRPDLSFQIPKIGNELTQLLSSEDPLGLLNEESDCSFPNGASFAERTHNPLTMSQLTSDLMSSGAGSSFTEDSSTSDLSQSSVGATISVLKAQVQNLEDSGAEAAHSASEVPSHAFSPVAKSHEVNRRVSLVDPHDQNAQHSDVLDQPATSPELSVHQSIVPQAARKLERRQSAGRQTVIAGGVVKRSKTKAAMLTNSLRSKAIGKHKSTAQMPSRTRNAGQGEKVAVQSAAKPTKRIPVKRIGTAAKQGPSTRSATHGAASSYKLNAIPIGLLTSPSTDKTKFAPMPQEATAAQDGIPVPDMRFTDGNPATVQAPCSTQSSMASTAVDRDPDRTLNCNSDVLTNIHIPPSEAGWPVRPAESAAPNAPHGAHGTLSAPSDQVEMERDPPQAVLASGSLAAPPSPMRQSAKRSAPDAPEDTQPLTKKGRLSQSTTGEPGSLASSTNSLKKSGSGPVTRASTRVLRSSRVKNTANPPRPGQATGKPGPSGTRPAGAARVVKKPATASTSSAVPSHTVNTGQITERTGQARQLTNSTSSAPDHSGRPGSVTSLASSTSRSADSRNTRYLEPASRRNGPVTRSTASVNSDAQHTAQHGAGTSKAHAKLGASGPAKATVPFEFHFHSGARVEARKRPDFASSEGTAQRTGEAAALGVPDFKAVHDAEQRRLASKKPQIVPILPGHVELSTEARAHEREKYDEARRAREAEAERLLEEQRRLQAIEEEKEIKELRRRMVPKANGIPEWYAHAPKLARDQT